MKRHKTKKTDLNSHNGKMSEWFLDLYTKNVAIFSNSLTLKYLGIIH